MTFSRKEWNLWLRWIMNYLQPKGAEGRKWSLVFVISVNKEINYLLNLRGTIPMDARRHSDLQIWQGREHGSQLEPGLWFCWNKPASVKRDTPNSETPAVSWVSALVLSDHFLFPLICARHSSQGQTVGLSADACDTDWTWLKLICRGKKKHVCVYQVRVAVTHPHTGRQ